MEAMASKKVIAICQSGGEFVKSKDGAMASKKVIAICQSGGEFVKSKDGAMASKKVIAICQSGGEFVKSKDGVLSYSGGEAYVIDIDQETQLSDFKKEVAETFNCDVNGITIKYLLPGNKKTLITVSKDKDLNRMVSFAGDGSTMDVFIVTQEAHAGNVLNTPASRSSRTTVSEQVTPIAEGCMESDNRDDRIDNEARNSTSWNKTSYLQSNKEQWKKAITGVDQRFNSLNDFREALHNYSLANGFAYRYKKNDGHRLTVKCKAEGCKWQIYASKVKTTQLFCIKTMVDKHTCGGGPIKAGCRATRDLMGSFIREKLKTYPNYKPKEIASDIRKEFGIQLNYCQARRAKKMATGKLQGSYQEAYGQLPLFCDRIRESNPGSIATFTTKEDSSFHRLFISFRALITGFQQGCRPLIFLDSAPLNTKYQEDLLAAISVDGDDGVFPVAFAIVDEESIDNWRWFLEELKTVLSSSQPITFVADFQNGLNEILPEVFTDAYHGYCLRYMAEKLNKDLMGKFAHEARRLMINDLYAAAYAPKLEDFERCVNNMKAISPEAYDWVVKSEPKNWANAFFEGVRYNLLTSNFGQLFFTWVSEADTLPITQMVDFLRGKMMELIHTRRVESSKWETTLTPSKEEKLEKEIVKSRSIQILRSHGCMFEVHGECPYVVDIDNWGCSCKEWQLTGLPCCHAIAVFQCIGKNPYDYCSKYFTLDCYRLSYAESIEPVPDVEQPVEGEESQQTAIVPDVEQPVEGEESQQTATVTVTPPSTKRSGRPRVKSGESIDILKRQVQCGKCKGLGHNKKTCKGS